MREGRVLAIFVKAPVAGRVKTRLAADLGAERAAALYRRLGRRAVMATAGGDHCTVVWYGPRGGRRVVRDWLDQIGVSSFHPQAGGHLGNRLCAAFARHFHERARRVLIIGSDCPGIDGGLIGRAFAALEDSDLVLGPAHDGGYYLIGLRALAPQLFRGIAWSTDAVLEQTLAQARQLGLSTVLLPTLRDVDTASDARAVGILRGANLLRHPVRQLTRSFVRLFNVQ